MVAPSQKMAKKLPGGVKLTTPAPTVLAGMYRKAVRAAAPTPDTVAGILAAALNARFVPAVASGLHVSAVSLKFCRKPPVDVADCALLWWSSPWRCW